MISLWDETQGVPLTRLQANRNIFYLDLLEDKEIHFEIKLKELQMFKYEKATDKEIIETSILKVTAFKENTGLLMKRKTYNMSEAMIFDDVALNDIELAKKVDQSNLDNFVMKIQRSRKGVNVGIEINNLKALASISDLLRVYEFINYIPQTLLEENLESAKKNLMMSQMLEPKLFTFNIVTQNNQICLPSSTDTSLIIESKHFSYEKRLIKCFSYSKLTPHYSSRCKT